MRYGGTSKAVRQFIHVNDAAKASVDILKRKFINQNVLITGRKTSKIKELLYLKEIFPDKIYLFGAYLDNKMIEKSRESIDKEGWLHSGDKGKKGFYFSFGFCIYKIFLFFLEQNQNIFEIFEIVSKKTIRKFIQWKYLDCYKWPIWHKNTSYKIGWKWRT